MKWKTICARTEGFEKRVPRELSSPKFTIEHTLQTFVDASSHSIAACVYLRSRTSEGRFYSNLIIARHRLTPAKQLNSNPEITIPKLELVALQIGMQLTKFICDEIDLAISRVIVHSDSQIALGWVHSEKSKGVFIQNRTLKSVTYRPTERIHAEHRHGDTSECSNGALICSTLQTSTIEYSIEWPYERLSSLRKALRSMALVLKFVKLKLVNCLPKARQDEVLNSIPELQHISTFKPLTTIQAQDTGAAESVCIKQAQRTINSSKLQHLNISKDSNGLMRCYGRLTHSSLPLHTINPILLPPTHKYTTLLIRDTHERLGHQGVNSTLANLRLRFWIPKGRQVVRKTLRLCSSCKRWNSRAYHYPDSPALPRSRATPSRVFESVGVDLAGPFLIIENECSQKRWVCLFTCMSTRAVHLEVLQGLSGECFINCMRRFAARRGRPRTVISDNATNFKMGHQMIIQNEKDE
ncbi:hypothetical protein OSTOST_07955 [Ostertagia ostertagi]